MRRLHYWAFQARARHPKVAQQNIEELCNLAAGLHEFTKAYLSTHGEKTPVARLHSMINSCIAEEIETIEVAFISGDLRYEEKKSGADVIPF
jgi:hypothetical protein